MSVWDAWEKNLLKGGEPFLTEHDRVQEQQYREGLDDLFTDVTQPKRKIGRFHVLGVS